MLGGGKFRDRFGQQGFWAVQEAMKVSSAPEWLKEESTQHAKRMFDSPRHLAHLGALRLMLHQGNKGFGVPKNRRGGERGDPAGYIAAGWSCQLQSHKSCPGLGWQSITMKDFYRALQPPCLVRRQQVIKTIIVF